MTHYAEADRIREERNAGTTMQIECCCCRKITGTKDGRGQTGTTSTICPACALKLLPADLHAEYHRRKQLEREGFTVSADRVAIGRCF